MDKNAFVPKEIRYIKLGRGGTWASHALAEGTIPFGYREIDHGLCASGEWEAVREQLIASGRTPAGASQGIRELQDFYQLDDDTLWESRPGPWCRSAGAGTAL